MARLPTVGGDDGSWGTVLNTFLQVALNSDGTLKNMFYNVKDYGATGDGTTDDTDAIQAALDACDTAGGGTVFFPAGTYEIDATLLMGNKTHIQGVGRASVIKQISGGNVNGIENKGHSDLVGNTDISISDIALDGTSTASMGIVYAGVNRGTISNVYVKDFTHYGIWLWASGEASSSTEQGIPTREVTVVGCHVTGVTDVGIEADAARSCSIIGNSILVTSGIAGIYLWNGSCDCTVTGNVIAGNGTDPAAIGIAIAGIDPGQTYSQDTVRNTIVGNTIRNVQFGIKFSGTSSRIVTDVIVSNNTIHCWTGTTTAGMTLNYVTRLTIKNNYIHNAYNSFLVNHSGLGGGTTTNSAIDGNYLYTSASQGSQFITMDACSVSNNVCTSIGNHALNFQGCTNMIISGNLGVDCGTATSGTIALVLLQKSGSTESNGNVVIGNRIRDTRGSKYLYWAVLLIDAADYNIVTGNSARGAYVGGKGYQNGGTGANNSVANNLDN